jgi:hypothetical protein
MTTAILPPDRFFGGTGVGSDVAHVGGGTDPPGGVYDGTGGGVYAGAGGA